MKESYFSLATFKRPLLLTYSGTSFRMSRIQPYMNTVDTTTLAMMVDVLVLLLFFIVVFSFTLFYAIRFLLLFNLVVTEHREGDILLMLGGCRVFTVRAALRLTIDGVDLVHMLITDRVANDDSGQRARLSIEASLGDHATSELTVVHRHGVSADVVVSVPGVLEGGLAHSHLSFHGLDSHRVLLVERLLRITLDLINDHGCNVDCKIDSSNGQIDRCASNKGLSEDLAVVLGIVLASDSTLCGALVAVTDVVLAAVTDGLACVLDDVVGFHNMISFRPSYSRGSYKLI
nr:MAG TPA: hypothetical protein [Caudoviricetes sp.]